MADLDNTNRGESDKRSDDAQDLDDLTSLQRASSELDHEARGDVTIERDADGALEDPSLIQLGQDQAVISLRLSEGQSAQRNTGSAVEESSGAKISAVALSDTEVRGFLRHEETSAVPVERSPFVEPARGAIATEAQPEAVRGDEENRPEVRVRDALAIPDSGGATQTPQAISQYTVPVAPADSSPPAGPDSPNTRESRETTATTSEPVADDADAVTVKLSASASTGEDGGQIVYTASLVDGSGQAVTTANAVTVRLENGETITIGAGQSSADSAPVAVNRDDVVREDDAIANRIASVSEANAGQPGSFERLGYDDRAVSTRVMDDADAVTVKLSASASEDDAIANRIASVSEANAGQPGSFERLGYDDRAVSTRVMDDADVTVVTLTATERVTEGGSITYTVSLSNAVTDSPLEVTLSNGVVVAIPVGATSAQSEPYVVEEEDRGGGHGHGDDGEELTVSIQQVTGGNFEALDTTDTATTVIEDEDSGEHGNEGVGNGEDPPPPGHDENQNDGPGTSPGHPGSAHGGSGGPESGGVHGGGGTGSGHDGEGSEGKGNEGVGNGDDPPPPGHDTNQNDGAGFAPGSPGSAGGASGAGSAGSGAVDEDDSGIGQGSGQGAGQASAQDDARDDGQGHAGSQADGQVNDSGNGQGSGSQEAGSGADTPPPYHEAGHRDGTGSSTGDSVDAQGSAADDHGGADEIDIDWGALTDEKSGKSWIQTLELSPEAHGHLSSGDWTLVVDGAVVDPQHLPNKLDDADVQITTQDGSELESFHGVDKIEWGNPTH